MEVMWDLSLLIKRMSTGMKPEVLISWKRFVVGK
jgi:hypothetical protein